MADANDIAFNSDDSAWDSVILPKTVGFQLNIGEIWRYRDLLMLFVKRDIVTVYKQTVLGPIWFVLQPIFTTVIFTFIFGRVAKIPHGTVPSTIFYLGSNTLWNYYADTFNITSKTFTENASVFGKVYFPRIILPLSKVISGLIKLGIQFALFFACWGYYLSMHQITPNWTMVYFPVLILILAMLSLGSGLIITAMTTKYRDLTFLLSFAIQLLMYLTPVIYPIAICSPRKQFWLWLNPLTAIFESFKYAFLGEGTLNYFWLGYSAVFTFAVLLIGVLIFNKVEKRFIDTV